MAIGFDLLYAVAAIITAPIWLWRMIRTGKIRTDWAGRFGRTPPLPLKTRPRLLLHAVSVGEVNAIRQLVETLASRSVPPEIVISVTTDTGFARANDLWRTKHPVVRYPFDFSFSVRRFLSAVQPDVMALVELEVWPNFVRSCRKRGIKVAVVNGRLTDRSARRYRRIRPLVVNAFRTLTLAMVQNDDYRQRFIAMGTPADRVVVTGTMKWDTAQIVDVVAGADVLAAELGIDRTRPLVVAGSTAPDEHHLLVDAVPPGVQLLCAPRKPEWFNAAAEVLAGCVRRTAIRSGEQSLGSATGRYLLDTIGELRMAYALADVVVVGRSFGDLHGSDMMEPIALGKPVVVGPAVTDFRDTMDALLAAGGVLQTTRERLSHNIRALLDDAPLRHDLAERGRAVIRANQGASTRTADALVRLLACPH